MRSSSSLCSPKNADPCQQTASSSRLGRNTCDIICVKDSYRLVHTVHVLLYIGAPLAAPAFMSPEVNGWPTYIFLAFAKYETTRWSKKRKPKVFALTSCQVKLTVLVRERSGLADPYCQSAWISILVRERSALADPYCQSAWISICVSATLRSNISKTKGARRKVTIGSL